MWPRCSDEELSIFSWLLLTRVLNGSEEILFSNPVSSLLKWVGQYCPMRLTDRQQVSHRYSSKSAWLKVLCFHCISRSNLKLQRQNREISVSIVLIPLWTLARDWEWSGFKHETHSLLRQMSVNHAAFTASLAGSFAFQHILPSVLLSYAPCLHVLFPQSIFHLFCSL